MTDILEENDALSDPVGVNTFVDSTIRRAGNRQARPDPMDSVLVFNGPSGLAPEPRHLAARYAEQVRVRALADFHSQAMACIRGEGADPIPKSQGRYTRASIWGMPGIPVNRTAGRVTGIARRRR